jgi:hypothetical protein
MHAMRRSAWRQPHGVEAASMLHHVIALQRRHDNALHLNHPIEIRDTQARILFTLASLQAKQTPHQHHLPFANAQGEECPSSDSIVAAACICNMHEENSRTFLEL